MRLSFRAPTTANWIAYPFRYKPQELKRRQASTPHISRVLTGTYGLPRSAPGGSILSFHERKNCLLVNDPAVLGSSPATRFLTRRRLCLCCILAILVQYKEQKLWKACGGGANFWGTYDPPLTRIPNDRFGIVDSPTIGSSITALTV